MYRVKKDFEVKGYYRQPIYDEFPFGETYIKNCSRYFKKGNVFDGIQICENKFLEEKLSDEIFFDDPDVYLKMNIKILEKKNFIYEMTKEEIDKYYAHQKALKDLIEAEIHVDNYEDYMKDFFNGEPIDSINLDYYADLIIYMIRCQSEKIITNL